MSMQIMEKRKSNIQSQVQLKPHSLEQKVKVETSMNRITYSNVVQGTNYFLYKKTGKYKALVKSSNYSPSSLTNLKPILSDMQPILWTNAHHLKNKQMKQETKENISF